MVNKCSVVTCNSESLTDRSISFFRFPINNENVLEKWLQAGPGYRTVSKYSCVCSKHFLSKDYTDWTAYGGMRKLNKTAVPSIFNEEDSTNIDDEESEDTDALTPSDTCDPVHGSTKRLRESRDGKRPKKKFCSVATQTCPRLIGPSEREKELQYKVRHLQIRLKRTEKKISTVQDILAHLKESGVKEVKILLKETEKCTSQPIVQRETVCTPEFVYTEPIHPKETQRDISPPKESPIPDIQPSLEPSVVKLKKEKCESETREDLFEFLSVVYSVDTKNHEKSSVIIPKSWGIAEFVTEAGQRMIFSLNVTKQENDMVIPVVQKSVMIDTDQSIRFFVYDRPVDPEKFELESVLKDATMLPDILERFQRMGVCCGIEPVNIHRVIASSVFKDSVDRWHRNDCMLLTSRKRCDHCVKMKQFLNKRNERLKKYIAINRVLGATNPMDQKNMLALRKNFSETRLKNRAKQLVQLLRQPESQS